MTDLRANGLSFLITLGIVLIIIGFLYSLFFAKILATMLAGTIATICVGVVFYKIREIIQTF